MANPLRISLFAFLAFISLLGIGIGAIRLALELPTDNSMKPVFGFLGTLILIGAPFIHWGYWRRGYHGALEAACLGYIGLAFAIPVLMAVGGIVVGIVFFVCR